LLSYAIISLVLLQIIRAGNVTAKEGAVKLLIRKERRLARFYLILFIAGVTVLSLWA
jgi:hypothetical protein